MKTKLSFFVLISLFTGNLLAQPWLDKQGHRGCRGLMPENSIAAMKKALDLGVNTLEMDVLVTADKQVIVVNDTYISGTLALTPDRKTISATTEKKLKFYSMNYDEVSKYVYGVKTIPGFPKQKKVASNIPLLSNLIDSVEDYLFYKNYTAPYYNIEIKSSLLTDNKETPSPEEYIDLVVNVIHQKNISDRVILQSYDERTLKILHNKYPEIKLSYLSSICENVTSVTDRLGFKPFIYSPEYTSVTKMLIKRYHDAGIRVVPWTVNTKEEIEDLAYKGADGIITDYPNLFESKPGQKFSSY